MAAFECPHCKGEIDQSSINARMSELTTKVKKAEEGLSAAEKLAEKHAQLAEEAKAALATGIKAKEEEFSSTLAFTEHQINKDPDVRTTILGQYNKLPTENRPALADQLAAWKAKPDEAPILVRPWLGPAQGGGQSGAGAGAGAGGGGGAGSGAGAGAGGRAAPDTNAGTQQRTDGGGAFQAGSAVKAVNDGSFRTNREALYAAAGLAKPPPLPGAPTT